MSSQVLVFIVITVLLLAKVIWDKKSWNKPTKSFDPTWRIILIEKIAFYNALSKTEKLRFEFKVQEFLLNCRITGIDVTIDITDKLLVASSAVIPIFQFPNWKYSNLHEVLLYPARFNDTFESSGPDRSILGMVGTGYMEGKMILSKPALHQGFENKSDKKNTAIHEFVHLIDKLDGAADGIPELLLDKQFTIPWLDLINKGIDNIHANNSDINPYGGTNRAEFFAVASEYFFERPKLFKSKHPELYKSMEKVFDHNIVSRNFDKQKNSIGRNSPCPCGSGFKFKKCCGKIHET